MGKRTAGLELRSAVALLDALDVGILALDGRGRPVALNSRAQDLLGCRPDGSMLPRPLLDLVDQVWRCRTPGSRELALGASVVRLHASPLEGSVLVQVHDISLLRQLQQAQRSLVAAISDCLLERVEGPALLVEALASVDDPVLAAAWLRRLRGDVAGLARLLGDTETPRSRSDRSPGSHGEPAAEDSTGAGRAAGGQAPRPALLLVEPVGVVADAMTVGLSSAGFDVVATRDAEAALEVVAAAQPDCVLVDLRRDHDAAARRLREVTPAPMVLLTSGDEEPSLPRELEADPATVVLRRPLRLRELVAQTRQALASAPPGSLLDGADGLLQVGDVVLDTRAHLVRVRGQRVPMSPRERQLLRVLLLHPGRMLTYERLLELAWGGDASGSSLGAYLRRLRRKIERDPSHPERIITFKGIGVRFEVSDA